MKHPPYHIVTPRLVLRCWNPDDAALLKAAVDSSLEHLKPWMPWARFEPTTLDAKFQLLRQFRAAFDSDKEYVYGVFSPDETEVWGGCGLHRRAGPEALEIGYWLRADRQGYGYAQETTKALVEAAFTVDGIDRVEVHHEPRNVRSGRVPEALGFTFESLRRRDNTTFPGEFRDSRVWVIYKQSESGATA